MVDWEDYHRRNSEAAAALRSRRVLIVGLGAMGSHLAFAFGRAGTPLMLIDFDTIEVANLHRHSIGEPSYVGWAKVQAVADRLRRELPEETSVSPVIGDVLTLDPSWLAGAIANSDLVLDASGNHASRLLLNHLCREQLVDFVAPSLWADDDTVGDVYVMPYRRWQGNLADRRLGCYGCDDRVGRPNELSAQAGSFAEIAWVGSAAAEMGLGLLLPPGHRSREMVDRALASRNYFIFERTPLRMQGGGVEINPNCRECNPRVASATKTTPPRPSTSSVVGRRVRRAVGQGLRVAGRTVAAALVVTSAIVALGVMARHILTPRSTPRAPASSEPRTAIPPARSVAPTPTIPPTKPAPAALLTSSRWTAYGVATMSVTDGVLEINSTASGIPGALFKAGTCNYRVAGEERIASGEGVGVAVRASIAGNSISGVAFQYDRQSGALYDSHYPEDTYWQVPAATNGAWHKFAVEVTGSRYRMSLDELEIFSGQTETKCGDVYLHVWDYTHAYFRNVTFERLPATS